MHVQKVSQTLEQQDSLLQY
jgi:hypothetical protein